MYSASASLISVLVKTVLNEKKKSQNLYNRAIRCANWLLQYKDKKSLWLSDIFQLILHYILLLRKYKVTCVFFTSSEKNLRVYFFFVACTNGTYGNDCALNCSGNCHNNYHCNKQTGKCDNGCKPGYTNTLCNQRM